MTAKAGVRYSEWTNDLVITPLVRTLWHQSFPYNILSPTRRKNVFGGHRAHAPIGCIPLAIAQILASLASRGKYSTEGGKWSILAEIPRLYPFSSANLRLSVAEMLRSIAKETIIWADYRFSMGTPFRALGFFKKQGFGDARLKWFDKRQSEHITSLLSKGKPLLFMGLDPLFDGHAWIVDGYIRKKRTKTTISDDGETAITEEIAEYLHCNFGWGGTANGYYPFGTFDTTTGPALIDPQRDIYGGRTSSSNFTRFLHYIEY